MPAATPSPPCDNRKCLPSLPDVIWGAQSTHMRTTALNSCPLTPLSPDLFGRSNAQRYPTARRWQNEDSTPRCMEFLLRVRGAPSPRTPATPSRCLALGSDNRPTQLVTGMHAWESPFIHTDTRTSPMQLASKLYLLFS